MSEDKIVSSIKSTIKIDLEDNKKAKLVYDALNIEFQSLSGNRASMDILLDNSIINIVIDANDTTAFRASINSAIKWMNLSMNILNLTENP